MKKFIVAFVLLCASALCAADTLDELLAQAKIPAAPFSKVELAQTIDGTYDSDARQVVAVYRCVENRSCAVDPQLLRYDLKTGALERKRIKLKKEDEAFCCGAPDGVHLFSGFTLLQFHTNPSLAAILVFDTNLNLVKKLLGFDPQEIAPGVIAYIEGMAHFASYHNARLRVVDLKTRKAWELFPIENDPLREKFLLDHEKMMPKDCDYSENDFCQADHFDNGVLVLASDGKGAFAVLGDRSVSHPVKKGSDQDIVLSDAAIYVYAPTPKGWLYCEQKVEEDEARQLTSAQLTGAGKIDFAFVARCKPSIAIKPDMSSAALSFTEF